ncbi:MAG: hypothetical protein ABEJ72_07395 [Candidatus Aenigmatarchaeota archaeon]
MPIDEHLGPGEEVESKYGNLYATNERIVDYTSKVFKERLDDISYEDVTSVNVIREGVWTLPVTGIVLFLFGFLIESYFTSILGAVLIFFGVLYRKGHYLVKSRSRDPAVVCTHRYIKGLWTAQKERAEDFIDTVKTYT